MIHTYSLLLPVPVKKKKNVLRVVGIEIRGIDFTGMDIESACSFSKTFITFWNFA